MKSTQTIEAQYNSLEKQSEVMSYVSLFTLIGAILSFAAAYSEGELFGHWTIVGTIALAVFTVAFAASQSFAVRANLLRILEEVKTRR